MPHSLLRRVAMLALLVALRSPVVGQVVVAQQEHPAPRESIPAVLEHSAGLLVALQESLDGAKLPDEWPYEGVYREGGDIPIGYRVGGTAISAWALIESPGYAESRERREAVARAIDFVLARLADERMGSGFSGSYDVRGWGHIYALELFLRLRAKELVPGPRADAIDRAIRALIVALQETEIPRTGGWNYARSGGGDEQAAASPFMTAPALLALYEARAQGERVDAGVVDRALDGLESSRNAAGAIPYTTEGGRDEWPGAIGRSPVTEMALLLAGRSEVARVRTSLENFLEHWEWLEKRRKGEGTHLPPYGIAPYYFFYAHAYAALAIECLPEGERAGVRERFLARLFQVREASGGWNDRVFARSENFGTAMAMLALLAPDLPRPASWKPD